jgi:cytochrome c556
MGKSIERLRRGALVLGAAVSVFAVQQAVHAQAAPANKADAEGIIFERQQIMLQLGKDSEVLGDIAAGTRKPDDMAKVAHSIAQGARDSLAAFQPNVPGGRSKPEVWSNWPDFKQRMEAFATNADKMAKIADTGSVPAVIEVMSQGLPCKDCHDVYRAPKKPAA